MALIKCLSKGLLVIDSVSSYFSSSFNSFLSFPSACLHLCLDLSRFEAFEFGWPPRSGHIFKAAVGLKFVLWRQRVFGYGFYEEGWEFLRIILSSFLLFRCVMPLRTFFTCLFAWCETIKVIQRSGWIRDLNEDNPLLKGCHYVQHINIL